MAKQILFDPPRPDPKVALLKKVAEAPAHHAEAILDAFEILQLLRDKGILEMGKGLLGSGEKVLAILTETVQSDEVIAGIRNMTIIARILGGMNPAVLEEVESGLARAVDRAQDGKTPSLFKILGQLTSEDSRRFLAVVAATTQALGKNMPIADVSGRKRKKTYKHNA